MTGILPLWADTTEDSPGSLTRLRFALRFTWKSFYVRLCAAIAIIIFLWHSRGEVTETVRSSTRGFRRNTLSDVYNNTLGVSMRQRLVLVHSPLNCLHSSRKYTGLALRVEQTNGMQRLWHLRSQGFTSTGSLLWQVRMCHPRQLLQ